MSEDVSRFGKRRLPFIDGFQWYPTTDGCELAYQDHGDEDAEPLILVPNSAPQLDNVLRSLTGAASWLHGIF